ncbi:cytochrome c oxidase subunit 6C-1-like [Phlebotomus argentipes]|uniref:cytochrome c oxidase subunit 6C-1-like n=1 Tax=Phlebotomus argentipes TaxID=94469 RepID=UPI002892D06D|nr:cytochrome c oxidase subunit 6C-1-like [Phlebotomus argentipes]
MRISEILRAVAVSDAKPNKPQLRGLHQATIKRNLAVAIGLAALSVVAMKFLYNNPRKERYAEFYKNYDADAAFERMKQRGVFDSVKPDE